MNSVEEKRGTVCDLVKQRRVLEVDFNSNGRMSLEGLASLREHVELLLGPMTMARPESTPIGDVRPVSVHPLNIYEETILICPLEGEEQSAVDRVGKIYLGDARDISESTSRLFMNADFLRYYEAFLLPGTAIAHEISERYPCTGDAVKADLRMCENSLIRAHVDCHQHSEWLGRMEDILRRAHGETPTELDRWHQLTLYSG